MSADIVNMQMYIQHGKPFPKKLKIKGIATTDTLLGYKDYTGRETSREGSTPDLSVDNQGYFGYTGRESSRAINSEGEGVRTFTNIGWIDTIEKRKEFRKEIKNCFNKDGDICWMPVQAFKDYVTAEQYGLFREDDYAALISKVLPKFLKQCGFEPDNILWWMDYHTNKSHPHTHLVFTEKIKTRNNPMLPMKALNDFKKSLYLEALNRQNIISGIDVKTLFKEKDILNKKLKESIDLKNLYKQERKIEYSINKLLMKIEDAEGNRLQYNSYHMKPYKEDIDMIINQILEHPDVNDVYEKFVNECKIIDDLSTKKLTTVYTNIQDSEIDKIRSFIGNQILKFKKEDISSTKLLEKLDELSDVGSKSEFVYSKNYEDATIMINVRNKLQEGDLTALEDLKKLVDSNNPYAMAKYGSLLIKGKFVEQDVGTGINLLREATIIGENSDLGFMKFFEKTYKSIYDNSIQQYEEISDDDESRIYIRNMEDANTMKEINRKLCSNDLSAIQDLKVQVMKNNPYAMAKYGGFLVKGIYVEKDIDRGLLYIKRASLLGNKSALGFMKFYEKSQYKNHVKKSMVPDKVNSNTREHQEGDFMFESNKYLKRILKGSRRTVLSGFRSVERKTKQMIDEYLEDNANEVNH